MTPIMAIGLALLAPGPLQPHAGPLRPSTGTFGATPPAPRPFYAPPPAEPTLRRQPSYTIATPPPPRAPQPPRMPDPPTFKPYRPYQGSSVYSDPPKPRGYVDFYKR
jgi:hypothetical protein